MLKLLSYRGWVKALHVKHGFQQYTQKLFRFCALKLESVNDSQGGHEYGSGYC